MTTSRITQLAITSVNLQGLQNALNRVQETQSELSSGKRISKPSDDPAAATDALRYRAELTRTDQYSRNLDDGESWLNTADSTLSNVITSVRRIRDLVLQGVNGTSDSDAREAIASEVSQLKDQLVALANTKYGSRPIFAGTADVSSAYDSSGAYQGNSDAIYRTIGPGGEKLQINVDGDSTFGTGSTQLFTVVQNIFDHLTSGTPTDVQTLNTTDLSNLDAATQKLQISLSTIGARANRADSMAGRLSDITAAAKGSLSQAEDVDLPKTITDLQMQQMTYQAALQATARVIQPSLVDFLK